MGTELAYLPSSQEHVWIIVTRCRTMVRRRALASAGAALVPIPALDIATDIGMVVQLITRINEEFGLTPRQIEQLQPQTKARLYQAMMGFGGAMVGKVVTADLVWRVLRAIGTGVTLKQTSRYVPIAGQALSAAISYGAMTYVGERHIRDCMALLARVIEPEQWLQAEPVN